MSRGLFRLVGVWSGCWVVRDALYTVIFTQLLFQRNALVFIIKSTKYYNLYFCLCILSPYMFQPVWVIFRGRNASA
jgi:hypothetical protein